MSHMRDWREPDLFRPAQGRRVQHELIPLSYLMMLEESEKNDDWNWNT
jgi:hypothetical protein